MTHLIIEQGKEVGREVAIPASGMKFGRSPANELVLDDSSVMLFHGRFFFKSDGTLWVTDFGAGEKTTVGGKPIVEQQLKVGDLVQVGHTAFRIINTKRTEEPAPSTPPVAPTPPEPPPEAPIDLGFKRSSKSGEPVAMEKGQPKTKSSVVHRLMQVVVSLLVLLVLVIVGSEMTKLSDGDKQQGQQKETLSLSYERVKADTSNIFRYHLSLEANGSLSIQIDELQNNLHYRKTKKLSDAALLQLAHGIEDAGFYRIDSDYAGTSQGQYDLFSLSVQRNRRYHRIQVINSPLPSAIERTSSMIEEFASRELEIPFWMTMPPQERIRYGRQALELGTTRYAERDVRYGNLAEAIKHFEEAKMFLENIASARGRYEQAVDGLDKATKERDSRYEEFMFRADRAIALREWQEAYRYLQILSELVPERDDPRHEKISAKLLSVEKNLR